MGVGTERSQKEGLRKEDAWRKGWAPEGREELSQRRGCAARERVRRGQEVKWLVSSGKENKSKNKQMGPH